MAILTADIVEFPMEKSPFNPYLPMSMAVDAHSNLLIARIEDSYVILDCFSKEGIQKWQFKLFQSQPSITPPIIGDL